MGALTVMACTAANPEFGDERTGSATATDALPTDTGSSTVLPMTTADPSASSDFDSGSTSTSGAADDRGSDPGTTAQTETGNLPATCDDEFFEERDVVVTIDDGAFEPPDCGALLVVRGVVDESQANSLSVTDCGACTLCPTGAPVYRFTGEGLALPGGFSQQCVEVVIARSPECEFRAFALSLYGDGGPRPGFIFANDTERIPGHAAYPEGLDVPRVEQLCTSDGCPDAGHFQFGFGTASYGPHEQTDQSLPLFDGRFLFSLATEELAIDPDCRLQVGWAAVGKT